MQGTWGHQYQKEAAVPVPQAIPVWKPLRLYGPIPDRCRTGEQNVASLLHRWVLSRHPTE